jgi:hypothetical protein
MKNFLINLLCFATIVPLPTVIIWLLVYIFLDPFKVIWHYDRFYENNAKAYFSLDKDYVSTKTFDNYYKKYLYNSFIFGNSRSIFYQISDWKSHIGQNNSCFHFDAAAETIFALHKKILYIDSKKVNIDNVLLVLDKELLKPDKPNEGTLYEISPQLVNNYNLVRFHLIFFSAFTSPNFFIPVIYFRLTNKTLPFMKDTLDYRPGSYDPYTNEVQFEIFEKMIVDNKYYTKERLNVFYERGTIQEYSQPSILSSQKLMLKDIYDVFLKHNTNFKIIISPLYDQIKLNQNDLEYLKRLFGKKNVFDYSGINNFTKDYTNFYENSHYRPHVSRKILDEIYNK